MFLWEEHHMQHPEASRQSQSPLADAQNSVDKVENAVRQVQSHPSEQMIQQAKNSIDAAENAMVLARANLNQKAVKETESRLNQAEAQLAEEQEQFE